MLHFINILNFCILVVIRFGQRCLNSVNSESECGHRMTCASGRCVCDKGNVPIELSRDETVCEPKCKLLKKGTYSVLYANYVNFFVNTANTSASLSERCNFTRQCQNEKYVKMLFLLMLLF